MVHINPNWTAAGREGAGGGWEGGSKGRVGTREHEGGREERRQRRMEDGREGARGGWEQGNMREGGREEAMMIGRERASVEEERVEGGRVAEGNERGREGC